MNSLDKNEINTKEEKEIKEEKEEINGRYYN